MRPEPTRDVAVLIPARARAPISDAIWKLARELERKSESQASAAISERLDKLVEDMARVAREIAP